MADGQVDPASLEGEALMRWYRRSPQEIEDDRRRAAADAYNRFFYPSQPVLPPSPDSSTQNDQTLPPDATQTSVPWAGDQPDGWAGLGGMPSSTLAANRTFPSSPALGPGLLGNLDQFKPVLTDYKDVPATSADGSTHQTVQQPDSGPIDGNAVAAPAAAEAAPQSPVASQQAPSSPDGTLWIAKGSGGYRAVRPGNSANMGSQPPDEQPADLPENPAAPEDADLLDIGNPYNRGLRKAWEKANGQQWPKTDDGRNYHVAHKRAIADGGTNTLDNIEPMHPDDHVAQHINNGDSARWARRAATARAFGGTVEPPTPGLLSRSLGVLGFLPAITGLFSGRIRTDTPMHFGYDMIGMPAPDDPVSM